MVNNPQVLQDHGPRNTDIRDHRKAPPKPVGEAVKLPASSSTPENDATLLNQPTCPQSIQVTRKVLTLGAENADPEHVEPSVNKDSNVTTTTTDAIVLTSQKEPQIECGAVVDIFRNGKPPRKRRPTTSGDQAYASSERVVFEDEDFKAFDKLPPSKRERLYFVANVKHLISPESTVIDYLGRIDLVKVTKLMALTKLVGADLSVQTTATQTSEAASEPAEPIADPTSAIPRSGASDRSESPKQLAAKRRSDSASQVTNMPSRKKARSNNDAAGGGSVFSFGEISPLQQVEKLTAPRLRDDALPPSTIGLNTPLPLTRNADTLFIDFGTSLAMSTAGLSRGDNSSATGSAALKDNTPLPPAPRNTVNEVLLKTEPGPMDFLAFVREKCYSYSQIRRMCVADGIMKDPQISTILCGDRPSPVANYARLKYLTIVMSEMGNKLDSSFNDFSAIQPRRSAQLSHISRAEKFLRKCFLIKLCTDIRGPSEAELQKFTGSVFADTLTDVGITDLLGHASANMGPDYLMILDSAGVANRVRTYIELAYEKDKVDLAVCDGLRDLLRNFTRLRSENTKLKAAIQAPTAILSSLIEGQSKRLTKIKDSVEADRKEANRRIIFDEDGVDVFLKRAQLEVRNYFVTRLNEVKTRRAAQMAEPVVECIDECEGWSNHITLKSTAASVVSGLRDNFGIGPEKTIDMFGGVTLSGMQLPIDNETRDAFAEFAALPIEVDSDSERDYRLCNSANIPDEKWWLYQVGKVPLTPVKRHSEEW